MIKPVILFYLNHNHILAPPSVYSSIVLGSGKFCISTDVAAIFAGQNSIHPFPYETLLRDKRRVESNLSDRCLRVRSDGSIKIDSGYGVIGGIFRGYHRDWIIGFCRQLRKCSILDVEL